MIRTALACTALVASVLLPSHAAAQPAQATATDAAPFMGDWTLTLEGPNGPGSFDLAVKVDKEKVVGEIANPAMPAQAITDIVKTEKSLVLRYTFTWEGNPVDAVISLTPVADGKVNAKIDFAGGAYTMAGSAAKKEKKQ
jgi:hypothetical protein